MRGVEAASSASKTTVTFMYSTGDISAADVAKFEALNPDIQVRQIEPNTTTMNAMFAAGNPPDIISAHVYDIPQFVLKNQIADITPFLQKSTVIKMSDLAPVNNAYRYDAKSLSYGKGPYWGIAKDWSQDGTMWYNAALFKSAGVALPSMTAAPTLDELVALGKKLTGRASGTIKIYGLDLAFGWSHNYRHILHYMETMGPNSSFFSADGSTCDFTTKDATTVLQSYVNWGKANIGPNPATPDSNGPDKLLYTGRSAMTEEGYWITGGLMSQGANGGELPTAGNYMLGAAPVVGSHRVSETYFSQGFVMAAKSQVKDAAWRLVEYFFGPTGATERARIGWGIPALKSVFPYLPKTGPAAQWYYSMQAEQKWFASMQYTPFASQDALQTVVLNETNNVILGKETLAQAQANMTSQVNKLLAAGKAALVG